MYIIQGSPPGRAFVGEAHELTEKKRATSDRGSKWLTHRMIPDEAVKRQDCLPQAKAFDVVKSKRPLSQIETRLLISVETPNFSLLL